MRKFFRISKLSLFFGRLNSIIPSYLNLASLDKYSIIYKRHLRYSRLELPSFPKSSSGILVDSDIPAANQVALIHFLPVLSSKYEANCTAYVMRRQEFLTKHKEYFKFRNSIFSVFGIENFTCAIYSRETFEQSTYFKEVVSGLFNGIESLNQLQNLVVANVLIGDLVYDYVLNQNKLWTIDLKDESFKSSFYEFMFFFNYWREYFSENLVSALCVGHSVYHYGIPARIAASENIDVFQVNLESIYRITKDFPFTFTRSSDLRSDFKVLDLAEKSDGMKIAEQRLEARFEGEYSEDVPWSTGSVFGRNTSTGFFDNFKKEKLKILIATHHFYDAPHFHGIGLYEDYLIWIQRLLVLSKECDYEWFIKVHPNASFEEYQKIGLLISDFHNVHLLPSDITHHEILDNGVEVALTMFGTIGLEYAYLGKTVINACPNHLSSSYDFTLTPKTVLEYEKLILNLKTNIISPSKNEILEFYYMSYIWHLKSWLVKAYGLYLESVGGYENSMSKKALKVLKMSSNLHEASLINRTLSSFLSSKDLRLNPRNATSINFK